MAITIFIVQSRLISTWPNPYSAFTRTTWGNLRLCTTWFAISSKTLALVNWVSFSRILFGTFLFPLLLRASIRRVLLSVLLEFMTSSHPLISELTVVRALRPANASSDYNARNGAPTNAEEQFLCSAEFVLKRREMAQPGPTRATYSQPRQPPCVWHIMTMPTHLPLFHLFDNANFLQNRLRQPITCAQLITL